MKTLVFTLFNAAIVFAFALSTQAGVTVTLSTGETLQGELVEQTPETLTLYHPVLGTLSIPSDKVQVLHPDDAPTAEPKAVADAPAPPAPEPEPAPKPKPEKWTLFEGWKSGLELGFNGSEGNTETFNIYLGFDAVRKTPTDVWKADASYFLNSNDGETSKNEFDAGLRREWLKVDSPWFVFAQGRFDFDEFAQYDYRVTGNLGLGYDFIVQEDFLLKLLGGVGGAQEFESPDEQLRPEGLVGFELEWDIKKGHKFTADTFFFPDLKDIDMYRVESAAAWVIKLDDAMGTRLKFGLKNEYESHTAGNIKHNDIKYFGAVVLDF